MASVHILIFVEIAGFKIVLYITMPVKKSSKVCNIKVCNVKKYCIFSSSENYMGTISKYIIRLLISILHKGVSSHLWQNLSEGNIMIISTLHYATKL